jgi:hypothetical protein
MFRVPALTEFSATITWTSVTLRVAPAEIVRLFMVGVFWVSRSLETVPLGMQTSSSPVG